MIFDKANEIFFLQMSVRLILIGVLSIGHVLLPVPFDPLSHSEIQSVQKTCGMNDLIMRNLDDGCLNSRIELILIINSHDDSTAERPASRTHPNWKL